MILSLLGFTGCAALIFISGQQLSRLGDILAGRLGWGKAWIGLVLMASVTSLPELTVGIGSVSLVGSPNLALGDIMGSCAFNLGLLSVLDAFVRPQSLLAKVSVNHILAASMSILLVALVGLGLYLPGDIVITRWIGFTSLSFIIVYFFSIRVLYRYEHKQPVAAGLPGKEAQEGSLKKTVYRYVAHSLVVVSAALFLPRFAENIALQTDLGESFIATLFLAVSNSLPEIAVSIASVRMGFFDMAVGNLLGSNIFNILILAIDDLFYTKGYLLKDASDNNLISVFSVIIMTTIAIAGLMYRQESKKFLLAWDTLLIFLLYVANILLLYILREGL